MRPIAEGATNPHSAKNFRMINFVVDLPVRVDDLLDQLPNHRPEMGSTIFLLIEFQLVDRETHHHNNTGDNRHSLYKERQIRKVVNRLTGEI